MFDDENDTDGPSLDDVTFDEPTGDTPSTDDTHHTTDTNSPADHSDADDVPDVVRSTSGTGTANATDTDTAGESNLVLSKSTLPDNILTSSSPFAFWSVLSPIITFFKRAISLIFNIIMAPVLFILFYFGWLGVLIGPWLGVLASVKAFVTMWTENPLNMGELALLGASAGLIVAFCVCVIAGFASYDYMLND